MYDHKYTIRQRDLSMLRKLKHKGIQEYLVEFTVIKNNSKTLFHKKITNCGN